VINPLYVKENYECALYFAFQCSRSRRVRTCHSNTGIQLMPSSPSACLITASVTTFDAVPSRDRIRPHTYTTPNKRMYEISTCTQLHEILYTDYQDVLVLSSTIASRYYNCSTDGSTSARNMDTPSCVLLFSLTLIGCPF
jgi:hypothetical protein